MTYDFSKQLTKTAVNPKHFTVLMGPGGSGKSILAAHAEDCIGLPIGEETGLEELALLKFPSYRDTGLGKVQHVFEALSFLATKDHSRKTLIMDNLTSFRNAVDEQLAATYSIDELSKYGTGSKLAYHTYQKLVSEIVGLRQKMNVILLAHVEPYLHTEGDTEIKMMSIAAPGGDKTNVRLLLESAADNVFNLRNKQIVKEIKSTFGKKTIASGAVQRTLYTCQNGNFFGKARSDLDRSYIFADADSADQIKAELNDEEMKEFWGLV